MTGDELVCAAISALPPGIQVVHAAELATFMDAIAARLSADTDVVFELKREALKRGCDDDLTAGVWWAWAACQEACR